MRGESVESASLILSCVRECDAIISTIVVAGARTKIQLARDVFAQYAVWSLSTMSAGVEPHDNTNRFLFSSFMRVMRRDVP